MNAGGVLNTCKSSEALLRISSDCKLLLLRKIMTVLNKEVTANYVPAAAVIRR